MASISGTSLEYTMKLTLTQGTQSVANNTTSLAWSLTFSNGQYRYENVVATDNIKVTINGTNVTDKKYTIAFASKNMTKTIASGTVSIPHNADGTKSISYSFDFTAGRTASYYPSSISKSGTMALTTIPRASTISSITNDGMTVDGARALTVNIARASTSFTHTVTYKFGTLTQTATAVATSNSFVVPLSWLSVFGSGGSGTLKGSVSVQTYSGTTAIGSAVSKEFSLVCPSASTISSSTASIEVNGTNTIAVNINRSNSNFTHKVVWGFGNKAYSLTSVATSTVYAIPIEWLNEIPNDSSGWGDVRVTTYNGTQQIGAVASKSFTLIVPAYTPALTSVGVTRVQPTEISSWDIFVQKKSNAKFTFVGGSGLYGSAIKEYKVVVDGTTLTSTTATIQTTTLNGTGTLSYTATITDTRNKTASTTGSISVVSFVAPSYVSHDIFRYNGTEKDDDGTQVQFKFKFSFESYGGLNTTTNKIFIKESTSSSYTEWGTFVNDTVLTISNYTFEINKAYNIRINVLDKLGSEVVSYVDIDTSYAIIDISNTGKGIGLLMMSSKDNAVQVGGALEVDGTLTVNSAQVSGALTTNSAQVSGALTTNSAQVSGALTTNSAQVDGVLTTSSAKVNGALSTNSAQVSGALTTASAQVNGHLSTASAYVNGALSTNSAEVYGHLSTASAYVNTNLVAGGKIEAGGELYANTIRTSNKTVNFYDNHTDTMNNTNRKGLVGYDGTAHLYLYNVYPDGCIHLDCTGTYVRFRNSIGSFYCNNGFRAESGLNGKCNLGESYSKFATVYATTSAINTSDRYKKKDFAPLDERYEGLFKELKPQLYKFIDGTANRFHSGFISQDVEESLNNNGLTSYDFAGFCKDKAKTVTYDENQNEVFHDKLDENGEQVYDYSLRYEEFIALNTHMIQKQQRIIEDLQQLVEGLKKEVEELRAPITE